MNFSMVRPALIAFVAASALLGGCATVERPDPLEPLNRKVFAFNDAIDGAVLKPVGTGYLKVVPKGVRTGVSNFFANPRDLWSAINLLLQGRPVDALSDVARFGTNTTIGLLGVFDVARPLGLMRHGEDLGQTLGEWGVGNGAYIVWPLLGSSTTRDSVDLPFEALIAPQNFLASGVLLYGLSVLDVVSLRANALTTTSLIEDAALDSYLFVRDAYLQRRRSLISNNGDPGTAPELETPSTSFLAATPSSTSCTTPTSLVLPSFDSTIPANANPQF